MAGTRRFANVENKRELSRAMADDVGAEAA
jgi:hypothetical protein